MDHRACRSFQATCPDPRTRTLARSTGIRVGAWGLVAFWDMGPECAIRACHLGDADDEVVGHVPWAKSHLDEEGGDCGVLDDVGQTMVGRAQLLYVREIHRGWQGDPWFRADLDSSVATWNVDPKFLR